MSVVEARSVVVGAVADGSVVEGSAGGEDSVVGGRPVDVEASTAATSPDETGSVAVTTVEQAVNATNNTSHPDRLGRFIESRDSAQLDPMSTEDSFELTARKRVSDLDDAIDLDAFTASFNVFRASTRVIQDLESTVHRPNNLSMAGFQVLFSLWVIGDSQPRQIAALSGVSRAAVSGVVATLERSGLVNKTKSEADRRLVTVSLTDSGREMVEACYRAQNSREIELLEGLSASETKELGRLLRKLADRDS